MFLSVIAAVNGVSPLSEFVNDKDVNTTIGKLRLSYCLSKFGFQIEFETFISLLIGRCTWL